WFRALRTFLPHAITATRIGVREMKPGVWVGLHARIDPTARLFAPCWIGEQTLIGPGAEIGPTAFLDDRVVIDAGARVTSSSIGPETYIGELISVERSLVHGGTVINWATGSCLQVPDAFLVGALADRHSSKASSSLVGRALAIVAMVATAPIVI